MHTFEETGGRKIGIRKNRHFEFANVFVADEKISFLGHQVAVTNAHQISAAMINSEIIIKTLYDF